MNTSSYTGTTHLHRASDMTLRILAAVAVVPLLCLTLSGELAQARPLGPPNPDPIAPGIDVGSSGYFSVRPDLRKCPSPLCGGVFVQRVNHRTTRCNDGKLRPECYVAEVDLTALRLPEEQESSVRERVQNGTVLLNGQLTSRPFSALGAPGRLIANEVWLAATDAGPTGSFFMTRDTGLVCFAAPCLSFQESKLNTFAESAIAGVDLSLVYAEPQQLADAEEALRSEEGILVAGTHSAVTGPSGTATSLIASQFYLAVQPGKFR